MHHLRSVFTKEKEEKAKFKLESKEKLKDDKKDKTKEKDKDKVKDKEKEKVKEKEKDKKDKKLTKVPSTVTSGVPFEEIFTLGVALPIFGVPLQQSVERSRCHDDTSLPLVVRDAIDFLQMHGLKSKDIYRTEPDKIKLQQLRKLYTDRGPTFPYHWDIPVACAMIKAFIRATRESYGDDAIGYVQLHRECNICTLKCKICPEHKVKAHSYNVTMVVDEQNQKIVSCQCLDCPASAGGCKHSVAFLMWTHRRSEEPSCTEVECYWKKPTLSRVGNTINELPDSILTQELHGQFEQATAMAEPQRELTLHALLAKLPRSNHNLLGWLIKHFHCVLANEQVNQANMQTISTAMGAALNMSLNLLTYLITKAEKLFPNIQLTKYVPPLLNIPSDFPDSAEQISAELRKQESLLNQIHAEMHAGFITHARDQQLWEAQRIVTQLKRKLRSVQKSVDPSAFSTQQQSIDEKLPEDEFVRRNSQPNDASTSHDIEPKPTAVDAFDTKDSPQQDVSFDAEFEDNFDFKPDVQSPKDEIPPAEPVKERPKLTEKELKVLRLELENAEYLQLKSLLQAKINSEQFEIVKLRSHVALKNKQESNLQNNKDCKEMYTPEEQELKQRLIKENALLEQKRLNLINQIFQERVACIQLKIELAMKEILSKS